MRRRYSTDAGALKFPDTCSEVPVKSILALLWFLLDKYPDDPDRWKEESETDISLFLVIGIVIIIFVLIIIIVEPRGICHSLEHS